MSLQPSYTYDVFISYSSLDQGWVQNTLLPGLEDAGIKVFRDFVTQMPRQINTAQAIKQSHYVVLVLTPDFVRDEWREVEASLAISDSLDAGRRRILPVLLKPCVLPDRISLLNIADFTESARQADEIQRIIRRIVTIPDGAASTNRSPDRSVLIQLRRFFGTRFSEDELRTVCFDLGIDYDNLEGKAKAGKARELVTYYERRDRIPELIAIARRLRPNDSWDGAVNQYMPPERLPQTESQLSNTSHSASNPMERIIPPQPYADPSFIDSLLAPSGTEPLESAFYIEREVDKLFVRELSKPSGTTTIIRAPRQTGKSSLLIRGVAQAIRNGSKLVLVDLQSVGPEKLRNLDTFLRYLANSVADQLELDVKDINRAWSGLFDASGNMTNLMEKFILPRFDQKIILALDEADRLLERNFCDSFFGLLRSWHNSRASSKLFGKPWHRLDMSLVISTDPSIFIKNINQSPFNVGIKIQLRDFDEEQVLDLNSRYLSPLDKQEIYDFMGFLGGHPYLTRQALYTMINQGKTWKWLREISLRPEGPFFSHLEEYVLKLRGQPKLITALKQIITSGQCSDDNSFNRLLKAGIVQGAHSKACKCRCGLYSEYLKDRLNG